MGENLAAGGAESMSHGVFSMAVNSGPVVLGVLLILIALSVWSWTIAFMKYLQFKQMRRDSEEFFQIFWDARNFSRISDSAHRLEASPLAQLFMAGIREFNVIVENIAKSAMASNSGRTSRVIEFSGDPEEELESVELALKRAEANEMRRLERGLTFLATVASAAPFIGLFGTVWGIMNAFHGLSFSKSTTLQAVAPGISEALVATAIGLAAAIPAAVAFNYCTAVVKDFRIQMNRFGADFMVFAKQQLRGG